MTFPAMIQTLRLELRLWAVEISGIADFIGFVGLSVPVFQAHFTPQSSSPAGASYTTMGVSSIGTVMEHVP